MTFYRAEIKVRGLRTPIPLRALRTSTTPGRGTSTGRVLGSTSQTRRSSRSRRPRRSSSGRTSASGDASPRRSRPRSKSSVRHLGGGRSRCAVGEVGRVGPAGTDEGSSNWCILMTAGPGSTGGHGTGPYRDCHQWPGDVLRVEHGDHDTFVMAEHPAHIVQGTGCARFGCATSRHARGACPLRQVPVASRISYQCMHELPHMREVRVAGDRVPGAFVAPQLWHRNGRIIGMESSAEHPAHMMHGSRLVSEIRAA